MLGRVAVRARGAVSRVGSRGLAGKADRSFIREAFAGRVRADQVFPFPCVLTDDQREGIEAMAEPVGRFMTEEVDSVAIDETHEIPKEILSQLGELGLFGMQIDEKYGGLGFTNTEYARLVEEISQDASIAVTLMAHQSIGLKGILLFGNEEQKAKYLPKLATGEHVAAFALTEPGAGSDAAGIQTKATPSKDGKGWELNGNKLWISNGGIANVFTVFARTQSTPGGEFDKITAFIVEKGPGLVPGKPETKLGIRGSNTVELAFENCYVPSENVLGEVGGGFKVAMQILNNGRFGLGAGAAAAMRKMQTAILDHVETRKQFGRPLNSFGMVQEMHARMAVSAYAAESMAYMTTGLIDGPGMDMSVEAAICKVYGSEAAWRTVDDCIQLSGGIGFMAGRHALPYERVLRDTRILLIFEGTNQILRLMIGLTAIRDVGEDLRKATKKLSNPAEIPGMLPTLLSWGKQRLGLGAEGDLLAARAATDLKTEAGEIDQLIGLFGDAVRQTLQRHGKNIVEQQLIVGRLADVAIDIYAASASIARATTSQANGTKGDDWQRELRLARAVARQSYTRGRANIKHALSKPGSVDNVDDLYTAISKDIADVRGYPARHPLAIARKSV